MSDICEALKTVLDTEQPQFKMLALLSIIYNISFPFSLYTIPTQFGILHVLTKHLGNYSMSPYYY